MSSATDPREDLLLNHGIDLPNDRLYLIGAVDSELYRKLVNGLTILNSKPKPKGRKASRPITVALSTIGGGVDIAYAMYDLMKSNPRPLRVVACGPAYSSGTLLLAAATAGRVALPHSSLMYHFGSSDQQGKPEAKYNILRHDNWVDIIIAGARHEFAEQIRNWHDNGGDKYLTPQEALSYGLIDEIQEAL